MPPRSAHSIQPLLPTCIGSCAINTRAFIPYFHPCNHRQISHTPPWSKKTDQLPPRPTLPSDEVKHVYLKGSGPGGQKINKTASAVQVTHLPTGLVVKSQATRSRSQNETIARRLLAEKIELLEKGAESRIAKKAERKQKKKASAGKKTRRKYRKLDEERRVKESGEPNGTVMDAGAATMAAIGIGGLSGGQAETTAYAEEDLDDVEDKDALEDDDLRIEVVEDELEAHDGAVAQAENTVEEEESQNIELNSTLRTTTEDRSTHSER